MSREFILNLDGRFQEEPLRMQVWAARSAAKKNQLLMEEWLTGKDKKNIIEYKKCVAS
jgi:hypothetical protein